MHDLAKVTRIQSIAPIEGKDRIELAKVENYDCVVSKGDFRPGDRCVYIFYDSILPERPEFEFLRKRCWSEKDMGFRIRPMQLGGVVSEGLVLPMSILPEGKYRDGQVVTDLLGIRAYEPPEVPENYFGSHAPLSEKVRKILSRSKLTKGLAARIPRISTAYPSFIHKSDEENIETLWDEIKGLKTLWYITEKVEGQSATYIYRDGKLECYSQSKRVWDGAWWDFAENSNLKKRLKTFCRSVGYKGIVVQGELCGPGIQKNIYKFDSLRLFVFGMMELDGKRLDFHDMAAYCAAMKLETVPLLNEHAELSSELAMVLKNAEGQSVLAPVPREGVVWRSESTPKHFKAKSRAYKVWFEEH